MAAMRLPSLGMPDLPGKPVFFQSVAHLNSASTQVDLPCCRFFTAFMQKEWKCLAQDNTTALT